MAACDPTTLMTDARCFVCMDSNVASAVALDVLCDIANGGIVQTPIRIAGEGAGEFIRGEGGEFLLGE